MIIWRGKGRVVASGRQLGGEYDSLRSPYKNVGTWRGHELQGNSRAWYRYVFIERERGDEGIILSSERPLLPPTHKN